MYVHVQKAGACTYTRTHPHMHPHTHTPSHSLSLSLTHTHTPSHSLSLSLSHTHTHTKTGQFSSHLLIKLEEHTLAHRHTKLTGTSQEVRVEGIANRAEAPWYSITHNTRMRASPVTQDIPVWSDIETRVCEVETRPVITKELITEARNVTLAA